MDPKLVKKLDELEERAAALSVELSDPKITTDMDNNRSTSRSYAEQEPIVAK